MLRITITILLLLILSADGLAQTVRMPDETVEVYGCDFEAGSDTNFDLWPDGWKRRRGRGYPSYVQVEIAANPVPADAGQRCLRMDLDGGAVSLYSPLLEVSPLFSYTLRGMLWTSGLVHDHASMEVIFYDSQRRQLESASSVPFQKSGVWREVLIGPVTPADPQVRWAVIALHLQPGDAADLRGSAAFDNLSFGRLPRMTLATNKPHNIYQPGEQVEITCRLSGFTGYEPRLRFELRDAAGRALDVQEQRLHAATPAPAPRPVAAGEGQRRDAPPGGLQGSSHWKPPITENGFYQVHVSVLGHRGLTRIVNLVIADPPRKPTRGEFGWSLPEGDKNLSLKTLASLLGQVGINWVKFPIWYENDRQAEQFARFAERLSLDHIEMVGVIDQPPQRMRGLFGEGGIIPVASLFVEPEIWVPAIDAIMTRLSLKIRHWQLGSDQDISFVNYPRLAEKLEEIRAGFNRFGQDIQLGVTWRSIDEVPFSTKPPLAFISYTADPPLTDDELRACLAASADVEMQQWVVLEPLDRATYSLETRARDLVQRMLAAKMGRARGIFVPQPFDSERGLMEPDGTPGPLLLPWRTAAEMLTGTEYLGSVRLPHGSSNHVFQRGDEAVMVVWNSRPTRETMYVGEAVRQIDLWGRESVPSVVEDRDHFVRQELEVGTLPTFITGVNAQLAKWRMSVNFETKEVASVFGERQQARYLFSNTFAQGASGTVDVVTPPAWIVSEPTFQFKLFSGEPRDQVLDILLGANASSGPQPVRLDFSLSADRSYRFSVYREIHVGLGDIELEVESHLDEYGNLVVDQHLTNKTDRFVSFNCLLFVPERRRERRQVFDLGRGRQTTRFLIPDGAELIRATLGLRAEEIGGARVLNHRIVAEE